MWFKRRMKIQVILLTRFEKQVLDFLANENTSHEIAEQMGISLNSVETYLNNLISKFRVKDTAGLIKKAKEKGFLNK